MTERIIKFLTCPIHIELALSGPLWKWVLSPTLFVLAAYWWRYQ